MGNCFSKIKPISESSSFPEELNELLQQYEKIQRNRKILLPPIIKTD